MPISGINEVILVKLGFVKEGGYAKESMEAESKYKDMLIQTLQDRLTSAVVFPNEGARSATPSLYISSSMSARRQYETLSKSNSCFREKYEETKKESGKKIHTLELRFSDKNTL
ncbi:hypothetical protein KUTeg_012584 [Tegillarca granosa]|uniref:Uncharacterized protein n=1 Tax=Tegillarca granosa TaxID=220873 RepID=A0ABQ9EZW5_TEGGR|nr:hypothetical protein KUTeg_012584 [Tegillarca granosa]